MADGKRVMVPVEPTEEIIAAGWIDKEDVNPDDIYRAMIDAAPASPTPPVDWEKVGQELAEAAESARVCLRHTHDRLIGLHVFDTLRHTINSEIRNLSRVIKMQDTSNAR